MTTNYDYISGIEIYAVLKGMGIDDSSSHTIIAKGNKEKVDFWEGLKIYHNGTYYAVVKGRIPLEVANIIYAKYPNNPYGIRVEGGSYDYIPIEHAVDDEFMEETKKAEKESHNFFELNTKYKEAEKKLGARNNKNKYIKLYHVDTREGLIILLSELADYYARKQGLEETAVKNHDKIMAMVHTELLKKLNPTITRYEWLKDNKGFIYSLANPINDDFTCRLKAELEEFDKTVNPYLNNDIELDSIDNYTQKVAINGSVCSDFDSRDYNGYRENCCTMIIRPINEESHITYSRRAEKFLYQLIYYFGQKEYLIVNHTLSFAAADNGQNNECLYMDYSRINQKQKFEFTYNIIQKTLETKLDSKETITPEKMNFILEKLKEATELAKTITINNMAKTEKTRKLVNKEN